MEASFTRRSQVEPFGRLWRCALAFALAVPAWAAGPRGVSQDLDISSWTADAGLPTDSVTSIQQTAEGFLWVGTSLGLARFDGWKFTPVSAFATPKASAAGTLQVTAQCVDASNHLWIGTEGHGVFRLDPGFPPPIRAIGMGLEFEKIHAMGADALGAVWIGTEAGLTKWERGEFSRVPLEPGLKQAGVLALQVTRSNNLWLTTRAGLRKVEDGVVREAALNIQAAGPGSRGVFEGREGSLWYFADTYLLHVADNRRFNYFRGGGAAPLQMWSICEGKDGQLWIGTSGQGLFNFRDNRFNAVDFRQDRDHSDVRSVFMDKDGQLWVGTRTGLLRLRERVVRWFGTTSGAATSLAQDTFGRIWAGFDHAGLFSGRAESLEPAGGLIPIGSQNHISSIYVRPSDSSFWMGTYGQGLLRVRQGKVQRFTTAHGLSEDYVLAICGGLGGRVWVSTRDGKVHRFLDQLMGSFDASAGLTGQPVTAMALARDGGLWVGTSKGEILRFFEEKFRLSSQAPGFEGWPVTALCEDSRKRLWVGTDGGGLGRLERDQWRVWRSEGGLPDGRVLGIEESAQGDLWIATAAGISKVPDDWVNAGGAGDPDPADTDNDPLPLAIAFPGAVEKPSATGWPRSMRAPSGVLWFATDKGVVNFNPADLAQPTNDPPVRIEAVRANGAPLTLPDMKHSARLMLPANLREVQIRFTSPSLAFQETVRFRHRLEGFDPDWTDSSETRMAQYGKLSGGDYTFRVQRSDREGKWGESEASLVLRVATPFWRTPAGLLIEAILLAGAVAVTVRVLSHRRLKRQLERAEAQSAMERERARIARDMHDELGAKLTKISFMSERVRNDVAVAAGEDTPARIESIAATSRDLLHSLDEIVWAVNPRNDTLESLVAYLAQYASEYTQNTSLELDLRMPGPLPAIALSAEVRHNLFLAFEEALGNALKHSGASRVRISMNMDRTFFQITVRDNGRGIPDQALNPGNAVAPRRRGGTGLLGMRERLQKIGGSCEAKNSPGEGATVILRIPTKTNYGK